MFEVQVRMEEDERSILPTRSANPGPPDTLERRRGFILGEELTGSLWELSAPRGREPRLTRREKET